MSLGAPIAPRAPGSGPASASWRADSDEALAQRAAAGDRHAFGELVDRYEGRLRRFALVRLGSDEDARDVAQETFCRAWRGLGRFDPSRSFATWILTIAQREVIAVVRTRQRRGRDAQRERERLGAGDPAARPDLPDAWGVARRVLDERAFELLWLRYAEDRTPAEIARIAARSAVSVRVQLHRARRALGEALAAEDARGGSGGGGSSGAESSGAGSSQSGSEASYGAS